MFPPARSPRGAGDSPGGHGGHQKSTPTTPAGRITPPNPEGISSKRVPTCGSAVGGNSSGGGAAAWASVVLQLLEAAKAGDVEMVCQLIMTFQGNTTGGGTSESANTLNTTTAGTTTATRSPTDLINGREFDGRHSTPLHFAAGYNRLAVVEVLLKFGADVHAKDKGGLVPLHNACSYGHAKVSARIFYI